MQKKNLITSKNGSRNAFLDALYAFNNKTIHNHQMDAYRSKNTLLNALHALNNVGLDLYVGIVHILLNS